MNKIEAFIAEQMAKTGEAIKEQLLNEAQEIIKAEASKAPVNRENLLAAYDQYEQIRNIDLKKVIYEYLEWQEDIERKPLAEYCIAIITKDGLLNQ